MTTREKAIERYEGIRYTVACFTGSKKDCDAVDMAFSALRPVSREQVEKVQRERDAAVSDLEAIMAYGGSNIDTCEYCKNGQCYGRGGTKLCLPEWRGPQEE